jgi:hypothetical protein
MLSHRRNHSLHCHACILCLQLRYYVDGKGKCVVRMGATAQFDYTHEYQGNAPKLVHTPLTDR